MKSTIIFCVLSVFPLGATQAFAQSPESFFPYHVGDTWQYTLDNTGIIYQTDIIVADSTDSIGGHYLKYTNAGYRYHIDTNYNVYELIPPVQDFYHHYKLDAEIGDNWLWVPPQSDSIRAKIVDIYPDTIFGINTMVKEIEYWLFISQTDSIWLATRFLASGFGLIAFWGEPGPFYHLSGAVIDSEQYGFIVSIDEGQRQLFLPNVVELYQNYPNPFNPITTIYYQLTHTTPVVLEVFNSLGQKVITLVNELQSPGTYKIRFDGANLSSGVYYYQIEANGFIQQKKMLLIK